MIVEIVHAAQITIRPVNRNRYRSPLATKSGEEPISDEGIKALKNMQHLSVLQADGSNATDVGITYLRDANPRLRVVY